MTPFYSISEIAETLGKDIYAVCNWLVASAVPTYFNGKHVDLADYDCFRPISGGTIFVHTGGSPEPNPDTVFVSRDALPESWILCTSSIAEAASHGPERDANISKRCSELKTSGTKNWQDKTAREYGVSKSAIKAALKRYNARHAESKPSNTGNSLVAQLSAANKRKKK